MDMLLIEDNITPSLVKEKLKDLRNYLAGRTVGITKDETLLEEVVKVIFCMSLGVKSVSSSEDAAMEFRKKFAYVKEEYPDIYAASDEILLGPSQIYYTYNLIKSLDIFKKRYDIIRDVYEVFIGSGYRGQEGQFFTPQVAVQTLVSMIKPNAGETVIDPACGSGSFLQAAHMVSADDLYGIDKDSSLVRLAKMHLIIYNGGSPKIFCENSLGSEIKNNLGGLYGKFDVVLANPPFGAKIIALESESDKEKFVLAKKWKVDKKTGVFEMSDKLQDNPSPQILFIERIHDMLSETGRAGIVVPESIISNPKHRYVTQYILSKFKPKAIIGMPEDLFKTSGKGGTHTKVALLVLEKGVSEADDMIFMAEAKWCGHDSRGRTIPKNDLPNIVENFEKFMSGDASSLGGNLGFAVTVGDIKEGVLSPGMYVNGDLSKAIASEDHDFITIKQLIDLGVLEVKTGDEVGKLAYGTGDIPFIRTSDISNWEIKSDPKHGLSEEIFTKYSNKQDVREGDILMVRDGTYLVGTCAYVTKYDTSIVYQSHIYKIRLRENEYFDRFYLIAALSSEFVLNQIKSLTFTQDIINTLGKRINDLVIPVRRDRSEVNAISEMVKKSIEERVEARELARKARQMVI